MNLDSLKKIHILKYCYSTLIVIAIFLVLFFIKGIFPFGDGNIAYYDLGQYYIPMYYYLHDVVHGGKTLFLDWDTAAAINMVGVINTMCLINPINLIFFYIVPREMILQLISLFVVLKVSLMALTSFILLDKRFNIKLFWKIVFSIMYAFCSYVFLYYTNVMWLDIAIAFPLLILSLNHLLHKNRILPYIIMLSFCLVQNLQLAVMLLFYLLFIGGLYIIIITPKDNRRLIIFNFGIGTLSGIMLSSVISLPAFLQITSSSRFGYSSLKYFDIIKNVNFSSSLIIPKFGLLIFTSLITVLITLLLKFYKQDKKNISFILISILLLISPIIFENINLLWHQGSYAEFPIRYGFMITLTMIIAACYFLEKHEEEYIARYTQRSNKINYIILIGCYIFIAMVSVNFLIFNNQTTNFNIKLYILFFTCYYFVMKLNKKKLRNILIFIAIVTEISIYSCEYIVSPHNFGVEHRLEYIELSNELNNKLGLENDHLSRIKNSDAVLNANYPFILGYPALSNWTHIISSNLQTLLANLGYTSSYTRIIDTGGTTFTDSLFNIKHTITTENLDKEMYTKIKEIGDFNLYKNNLTLPFGITTTKDILDGSIISGNPFEIQNNIYNIIANTKDNLFETCKYDNKLINISQSTDENGNIVYKKIDGNQISYNIFSMKITGKQALYLKFYNDFSQGGLKIKVDNEYIPIPSVSQKDNIIYPAVFNNNVINLGCFNNESIDIVVEYNSNVYPLKPVIETMDLEKTEKLNEKYKGYSTNPIVKDNTLELTVESQENDKVVFIPITYDKGWQCTVNGEKVEVNKALDSFIGIKINSGKNVIKLKFIPPGMNLGIIISTITLLLIILFYISTRFKNIKIENCLFIMALVEKIFFAVIFSALLLIYIIPIIYNLLFIYAPSLFN